MPHQAVQTYGDCVVADTKKMEPGLPYYVVLKGRKFRYVWSGVDQVIYISELRPWWKLW